MLNLKTLTTELPHLFSRAGINFNLLFMLEYTAVVWVSVWLLDAGFGTRGTLLLSALQHFGNGVLLLLLFSFHNSIKRFVYFLLIPCLIALLLAPAAIAASLNIVVLLGFIIRFALGGLHTLSLADAIVSTQKSERKTTQLALLFLLPQILTIILTVLTGYIATPHPSYALSFCGLIMALSLGMIGRYLPFTRTDFKQMPNKLFQELNCRQLALFWVSNTHNLLGYPIWYILMPLSIYQQFNKNPAHLGAIMGLILFVGFIAQLWRKEYLGKNVPTALVMEISILTKMSAVLFWALTYNHPWLGLFAIVLNSIASPFWNFGYFAELDKCSKNNKEWAIYHFFITNKLTIGLGFLVLSCFSLSLLPYMKMLLWVATVWFALIYSIYLFINKKARTVAGF